jgi:preprotein translocase subunit SecY
VVNGFGGVLFMTVLGWRMLLTDGIAIVTITVYSGLVVGRPGIPVLVAIYCTWAMVFVVFWLFWSGGPPREYSDEINLRSTFVKYPENAMDNKVMTFRSSHFLFRVLGLTHQ